MKIFGHYSFLSGWGKNRIVDIRKEYKILLFIIDLIDDFISNKLLIDKGYKLIS
jgi:hypothetical protein